MPSSSEGTVEGEPEPRMAAVWALKTVPLAVFLAVFVVFAIAVLPIGEPAPEPGDPGFGEGPQIRWGLAGASAAVFVGAVGVGAALYTQNYRWEVGEDDVRVHRGLVYRRRTRVPYERVQNVNLDQSVLMRPFGLWNVELETAGAAGPRSEPEGVLAGVDDPERWEELVRERMDAAGDGV